jgi:hypothetical protein
LAIALGCWAAPVRAAVTARLFYGRSPDVDGCPNEEGLRREIARRVGYDPIVLMSPNSLAVTITRRGNRLWADVRLVDRNGVLVGMRTLTSGVGECAELSNAIALAAGIALDMIEKSTAAASQAEPEPPPPTAPPAAAPVAPVPAPPPPPDTAQPTELAPRRTPGLDEAAVRWEAGAAVAGSFAVLSAASAGFAAFGSVRWVTWEIGIEARAELSARTSPSSLPAAGLQTWLVAGGPFVCAHAGPWFGCLLASAGLLSAEVSSVPGAHPGRAPYVGLGGRAGVTLPLPGGLELLPSLGVVAQPVELNVTAAQQNLWHASPVAGVLQLAVAKRFP